MPFVRIGEAARQLGITAALLKRLERKGLFAVPRCRVDRGKGNGDRIFSEELIGEITEGLKKVPIRKRRTRGGGAN